MTTKKESDVTAFIRETGLSNIADHWKKDFAYASKAVFYYTKALECFQKIYDHGLNKTKTRFVERCLLVDEDAFDSEMTTTKEKERKENACGCKNCIAK